MSRTIRVAPCLQPGEALDRRDGHADDATDAGGVPGASERVDLGESELGCLVRVAVEGEEHGELTSADPAGPCRRDSVGELGGSAEPLDRFEGRVLAEREAVCELSHRQHRRVVDVPGEPECLAGSVDAELHPTAQCGVDSAVSEHIAQPIRVASDSSVLDLVIAVAEPGGYVTLKVGAVGQHVVEPSALDAAGGLGGETLSGVFLSGVEGSCDAGGPPSNGVEGGSQLDRLSRHRQRGLRPCAELEELPPLGVVVQGGNQFSGVSGNVAGNGMLVGGAQVGQVDRDS